MKTDSIKKLHRGCSDFERMLREARLMTVGLKSATEKVLVGLSELKTVLQVETPCSICFEHKRRWATNCGHLICDPCKQRLEAESPTRCFHCRTIVTSIIKVYL